jgi:hypothetical protein
MAAAMAPHRPLTSVPSDVHGHVGASTDQGRPALVQDGGGVSVPRGAVSSPERELATFAVAPGVRQGRLYRPATGARACRQWASTRSSEALAR